MDVHACSNLYSVFREAEIAGTVFNPVLAQVFFFLTNNCIPREEGKSSLHGGPGNDKKRESGYIKDGQREE